MFSFFDSINDAINGAVEYVYREGYDAIMYIANEAANAIYNLL